MTYARLSIPLLREKRWTNDNFSVLGVVLSGKDRPFISPKGEMYIQ